MRPRASSGESKFYLNAIPTRSRIIVIIATPSPSRQLKSALGRPQPPARSCHSRVRPFSIQRFVMVKVSPCILQPRLTPHTVCGTEAFALRPPLRWVCETSRRIR